LSVEAVQVSATAVGELAVPVRLVGTVGVVVSGVTMTVRVAAVVVSAGSAPSFTMQRNWSPFMASTV